MTKIAHIIASTAHNAAFALAAAEAESRAVARDQEGPGGLTRIIFDDGSFLAAWDPEWMAVDCDDPEELLRYAASMGATPGEARYVRDTLERNHGYVVCEPTDIDAGWSIHEPGSTDEDIASGEAAALLSGL